MSGNRPDKVSVKAENRRVTEKAILAKFLLINGKDYSDSGRQFWIPKSQIVMQDNDSAEETEKDIITFLCPVWLLEKNNIFPFASGEDDDYDWIPE